MFKKVFFIFTTVLFLVIFSCNLSVSPDESKQIPLGTYMSAGGEKIVFDSNVMTIYNSADDSVLSKYAYKYENGNLLLRLNIFYDSDGILHNLTTDSADIKSKFKEIESSAIPEAQQAIQDIIDYGYEEYDGFDFTLYGEAVSTLLSSKVSAYLASLKSIYLQFLKKKFQNFYSFNYTIKDNNIILEQISTKSITDIASSFSSGENILNDFDSNIPFKIEVDGNQFIGTPAVTGSSFSAVMLHYYDYTEPVETVVEYYKSKIEKVILENKTDILAEGFYYVVYKNRYNKALDIPVAIETINTALSRETLTGNFSFGKNSVVFSDVNCSSPSLSDFSITLSNAKQIFKFNNELLTKTSD